MREFSITALVLVSVAGCRPESVALDFPEYGHSDAVTPKGLRNVTPPAALPDVARARATIEPIDVPAGMLGDALEPDDAEQPGEAGGDDGPGTEPVLEPQTTPETPEPE